MPFSRTPPLSGTRHSIAVCCKGGKRYVRRPRFHHRRHAGNRSPLRHQYRIAAVRVHSDNRAPLRAVAHAPQIAKGPPEKAGLCLSNKLVDGGASSPTKKLTRIRRTSPRHTLATRCPGESACPRLCVLQHVQRISHALLQIACPLIGQRIDPLVAAAQQRVAGLVVQLEQAYAA